MVDTLGLTIIAVVLGFLWILYRRRSSLSKLPPGPKGWPLVGNAFQMDPVSPHFTWSSWADRYGELYTINNFGTPLVMCSSFEGIWEMLVSKSGDFAGRPQMFPLQYMTDGAIDIAMSDFTPHWAYRKKVLTTSIKMYGDGLERLENIMSDITIDLVKDFQKTNKKPFDPMELTQLALCNTLSLLLLGDRFDNTDPDFHQLMTLSKEFTILSSPSLPFFLIDTWPWLRHIPFPYCRLMKKQINGLLRDWIPRMIQRRKVHYDEDSPSCVLDAFIKQHESDMKTNPQYQLEERHIIALCQDVFIAGLLTSSSALYSMIALLTTHQDIQAKTQAEIDAVLGGRRPKLQDKHNMHYFQALLEEVLRYTVVTVGLPHMTTKDTTLCGHFIPKDTQVWPNVWHLCHEPTFWEHPWTFRPERFLDVNGVFLPVDHPARKRVMVFGAGRRICAGELLARNRLFLIAVSMLQSFVFKPAADDKMPECDPHKFAPGVVFKPEPYQIRAVPRD